MAGIIEPGEHPAETPEREIAEEAGLVAEVERIADPPLGGASLRRIGWAVSGDEAAAFRRTP